MSHTPEPWYAQDVFGDQVHDGSMAVCAGRDEVGNPNPIAGVFGVDGDHRELSPKTKQEATANANRIVACVNACEGIKDPSVIPQLLEDVGDLLYRITDMLEDDFEHSSDAEKAYPHLIKAIKDVARVVEPKQSYK